MSLFPCLSIIAPLLSLYCHFLPLFYFQCCFLLPCLLHFLSFILFPAYLHRTQTISLMQKTVGLLWEVDLRSIIVCFYEFLKFRFNIGKDQIFISPFWQRQTGRHRLLCTRLCHFPGHGNQNAAPPAPVHKQTMRCSRSKGNDVSAHQRHGLSVPGMRYSEIVHSATAFAGTEAIFTQILYFCICLLTFQHTSP